MVTVRGAYCVIVGSIFDANQQNNTSLDNLFYHRDVITIAKLKTWAPCEISTHLYNYVPILIQLLHFCFVFLLWHATDHQHGLLKFVFASHLTGVRWKLIRICV